MSNYLNSETIGLHGGSFRKDDVQTSVAVPIHQTSSFQFNSTNHAANLRSEEHTSELQSHS